MKIKSLSGEFEHFLKLKKVFIRNKESRFLQYIVENIRLAKDVIIMKLEGINTPELVKQFNGCGIWVERDFANPKEKDEYYYADLCLCSVYLDGKAFGRVKSVIDGSASELLEVVTEAGKTVLVPFMETYVGTIDIDDRKILLKEASKEL